MTFEHASSRTVGTDAVKAAAAILRRGDLVAFPTETVYGLGADATDDRAVAGIFAAKSRPRFNPLIVHVRDLPHAERFAEFTPLARELAEQFWPGPLTLVLPRRSDIRLSLLVSAGLETVALRAPAHPVAQALLREAALPLAAPSANASGEVSPTTAGHVRQSLGDKVTCILDGGPTPLGIESTVLGFESDRALLLRPGAVARADIEPLTGALASPRTSTVTAPGQLASHYAPRSPLRLNADKARPGELLLGFGPAHGATRNLSETGDLKEAAANLFAMLRELDALDPDGIAVMPMPDEGLGEAINDRLRRAAAPRGRSA